MKPNLFKTIEIVSNQFAQLGESPVWDSSNHSILWTDILKGIIYRFLINEKRLQTLNFDDMVSCVALREKGGLLAAFKQGLALVDEQTGRREFISSPESHLSSNRFNDGKCDAFGRFWIGSMSLDEQAGAGNVYMLNSNHETELKIEGVSISNGMAWSPDNKLFYYIDTPTRQVAAYDYDVKQSTIDNKRAIILIDRKDGFPDGMTVDRDGMLWIAFWGGWKVARYNPYTGKLLENIMLPVSRITSCTFGGEDLSDMYVTSAKIGLTEHDLQKEPLAGALFVIKNCGASGKEVNKYKG